MYASLRCILCEGIRSELVTSGRRQGQHNMHTCLEYDIENQIDYILFQKSWFAKDNIIIISHSAYYYIMSEYQNIRFRVVIFVRK